MRVLHVIPSVGPHYGGPSMVIWPMLAALREKAGLDIELATTDVDGPNRITRAQLPPNSGTVHLLPGPNTSFAALAEWLETNAGHYDLIHAHSLWNGHISAAGAAARRHGVPYILRPCGMLSRYTWRRRRLKKYIYWWAKERCNVLGAAAVHATSPVEAADVRACGVTAPVREIPLGMESAAFDVPARPGWLREKCPGSDGKPIILFLSRIHPKKGILDFLLPAFSSMQADAYLAIAGGTDPENAGYEREVRAAIEHPRLAGRTAFLGKIPPEDRWAAFDGAAVFCLPSHSENFGVVVTEAMARGCPVVVSEHVDSGLLAVAANSGISVPLNVGLLADALELSLSDPGERARRGAAGREYVRHRLAWPAVADAIASLYGETTG